MMKKKILTMVTICTVAAMAAGCGAKTSGAAASATASAETTSSETAEASKAKAPTKPDLSAVDPKEAMGPGAFETEEETDANESIAAIQNQNMADLENSDYKGFAETVLAAVSQKDMEGLSDLMVYPAYVGCALETNGMIDNKDSFLALGAEKVFSDDMVKAMENVDISALKPSMAGVVLGEGAVNIIFNSVNGELKIVGMNY